MHLYSIAPPPRYPFISSDSYLDMREKMVIRSLIDITITLLRINVHSNLEASNEFAQSQEPKGWTLHWKPK